MKTVEQSLKVRVPVTEARSGHGLPSLRPASDRLRLKLFLASMVIVTLAFSIPLIHLARLALDVSLHSHVILIPFISAYLAWQQRLTIPVGLTSSWGMTAVLVVLAALLLTVALAGSGFTASPADALAPVVAAWVCLILAAGMAFLGFGVLKSLQFPALFLFFTIPVPSPVVAVSESILQHLSASAASFLFWASGETYLREGLRFRLPGLTVEVARECSGIRSTLVLIITGLLAAKMLLRTAWGRATLLLSVIPLAVIRNGFRVFSISWLTVHVDSGIIEGPLHHRGGPVFFAFSLIVLLSMVWIIRKLENRIKSPGEKGNSTPL